MNFLHGLIVVKLNSERFDKFEEVSNCLSIIIGFSIN